MKSAGVKYFPKPPNSEGVYGEPYVEPNIDYQKWVQHTFSVTIPPTAAEIVRHPSTMDDDDSDDPFNRWAKANTE